MKKHVFATACVSLYLVVYVMLNYYEAPWQVIATMFLISPVLVIWMAYSILKHANYDGRDLESEEEWGYQDKPADFGKRINQRSS